MGLDVFLPTWPDSSSLKNVARSSASPSPSRGSSSPRHGAFSYEASDEAESSEITSSPSATPVAPYNPHKEFEDLHRDYSLFPAYTDYLYGPDTRPQTFDDTRSALDTEPPHVALPMHQYRRNWVPPEEMAFQYLHRQPVAPRTSNNFPQLMGLTRAVNPSPTPTTRATFETPVNINRSVDFSRDASLLQSPSISYLTRGAPAGPHSRGPSFSSSATATMVPLQPTQTPEEMRRANPAVLVPGEITGTKYQGLSDDQRQAINTRVIMAWTALQSAQANLTSKQGAKEYLVRITYQVQNHHSALLMRDAIKTVWHCLKIKQKFPPEHPEYARAHDYLLDFKTKLTPAGSQHVTQALASMTKAENEGRDPFDEVGLKDPSKPTLSPSAPPIHHPAAAPAWATGSMGLPSLSPNFLPNFPAAPTMPQSSPQGAREGL
ncbi:hypothetical protein K505DRAFT_364368 [Melanomma pulvis-pyrius CBS 109.77]|uniref:Uncharacterized protein n=1 Tax=Melanomma pulvis-pyrius CBS 109.77 TaxID=1314802 RepID=A0A6A6X3X1_9PLEO|nr:hypothetical protein K505DRAFT_364368 [Melanomma pulvis-pyrius CBS 109.77]